MQCTGGNRTNQGQFFRRRINPRNPLKHKEAGVIGELVAGLGVYATAKARQPAGLHIVRGKVG